MGRADTSDIWRLAGGWARRGPEPAAGRRPLRRQLTTSAGDASSRLSPVQAAAPRREVPCRAELFWSVPLQAVAMVNQNDDDRTTSMDVDISGFQPYSLVSEGELPLQMLVHPEITLPELKSLLESGSELNQTDFGVNLQCSFVSIGNPAPAHRLSDRI